MKEKKRNSFKLRQFRGVKLDYIEILEGMGIINAGQMLIAGQTKTQRTVLAQGTNIPEEVILEYVKLSDLARLPGVKAIRARLYYDAGVDSIEKMASWEPVALQTMMTEYIERTGFNGVPPLPKEVSSTIANAQMLPKVVEY